MSLIYSRVIYIVFLGIKLPNQTQNKEPVCKQYTEYTE